MDGRIGVFDRKGHCGGNAPRALRFAVVQRSLFGVRLNPGFYDLNVCDKLGRRAVDPPTKSLRSKHRT
jgi:hypothetical protein